MPRQVNPECRPLARFAVNIDEAIVLLDHAVYGGQPQTGALAGFLGGEKRLEDVAYRLQGSMPQPLSLTSQQYIFPRHKSYVIVAVGLVEDNVARFDGDFAHICDGVPGVDAKVGQDLVDLGGVHFHRPQIPRTAAMPDRYPPRSVAAASGSYPPQSC